MSRHLLQDPFSGNTQLAATPTPGCCVYYPQAALIPHNNAMRLGYGHVVVIDNFIGETERQSLIDTLTQPGWDRSQGPPSSSWERETADLAVLLLIGVCKAAKLSVQGFWHASYRQSAQNSSMTCVVPIVWLMHVSSRVGILLRGVTALPDTVTSVAQSLLSKDSPKP